MTSLAVTLAIGHYGPSALYIIADSRITWSKVGEKWDCAQKTFTSQGADIFGFCGDAYFPPAILQQVLLQSRLGLLHDKGADSRARHLAIIEAFRQTLKSAGQTPISTFSLFHGARDGEGMNSRFMLWEARYSAASRRLVDRSFDLEKQQSCLVHVDGSGGRLIKEKASASNSRAEKKSRFAITAFCEALISGVDSHSGGAPQLVGIGRRGAAKTFGFVWNERKFVAGLELAKTTTWKRAVWFNRNFEQCDGNSGLPKREAPRRKSVTR